MIEGVEERVTAARDAVNDRLPPGLRVGVLTLYWYSTRSNEWLDRLAARPAWRRWTDLSVLVLLVVQVADLGVLTILAFWLALLNANFGLLNALPVSVLDGGRALSLAIERLGDVTGTDVSPRARWLLLQVASVGVVALVVVALFAPLV